MWPEPFRVKWSRCVVSELNETGLIDECPKVKINFTRFYISAEDCPRHDQDYLASEKE
ncbi:hypothetical protein LCGC14_3082140, partial [marine sediment metagenome]